MSAAASSLRFDQLTPAQGLSSNVVTFITRSSAGFMWLGTADGLNRFDGYQFKHFHHNPQQPDSLSDSYITAGFYDSKGTLWVGTGVAGLNRYNNQTQGFDHFLHDPRDPASLSHHHVTAIAEDAQGFLWVGTSKGLNRFNPKQRNFQHFKHDKSDPYSLSHDDIRTIYQDLQGDLWIGTKHGLNRFNAQTDQFERFEHDPSNVASINSNDVRALYQDNQKRFWVGTKNGGLNLFDTKSGRFTTVGLQGKNNDSVTAITQDTKDNLWIGTYKGLCRLDTIVICYRHQLSDPNSISSDLVLNIYADPQGLVWAGTFAGGASSVDTKLAQFGHFKHSPSDKGSLSHNSGMSLYK
ncbi:MAG: GGDEF domain-containing protein, partial [Algicola sp.]|nr:GGDEF domain-containing protein [Algicola sp.]